MLQVLPSLCFGSNLSLLCSSHWQPSCLFLAQSPTRAEIPSALRHLNFSACCLQSNKQLKLVESLI